jgi:hypothetical protein
VPPKLEAEHRAFLSRVVEEGPIPAVHGVVRWRACDLIALLQEEFGLSVLDDTVYRALKDLGFAHLSARPRAYRQDAEAVETFKKRMARPVCKRFLRSVSEQSASTYPACEHSSGQDGDPRVLVLINFTASSAIF